VQPGETIFAIAGRYGVEPAQLLATNGLGTDAVIRVGQTLTIPRSGAPSNPSPQTAISGNVVGITHTLAEGETVSALARLYGVSAAQIAEANGLDSPGLVRAGTRLIIPGATAPLSLPTATRALPPTPTPGVRADSLPTERRSAGGRGGATLAWPAYGSLSQRYGEDGHTGIDIMADMGDPIVAAGNGVVSVALRSDYGYGWRVVIDHGGGLTTLYSHLSAFYVVQGERVTRGQLIGLVGSTGFSTGPHLHFEVQQAGTTTDPLRYLP